MAINKHELEQLIRQALPGCHVEINDLAGDGDHYSAYVEHESFAGISRVEQHRLVYSALGQKMGNQLHALALQTAAPKAK